MSKIEGINCNLNESDFKDSTLSDMIEAVIESYHTDEDGNYLFSRETLFWTVKDIMKILSIYNNNGNLIKELENEQQD